MKNSQENQNTKKRTINKPNTNTKKSTSQTMPSKRTTSTNKTTKTKQTSAKIKTVKTINTAPKTTTKKKNNETSSVNQKGTNEKRKTTTKAKQATSKKKPPTTKKTTTSLKNTTSSTKKENSKPSNTQKKISNTKTTSQKKETNPKQATRKKSDTLKTNKEKTLIKENVTYEDFDNAKFKKEQEDTLKKEKKKIKRISIKKLIPSKKTSENNNKTKKISTKEKKHPFPKNIKKETPILKKPNEKKKNIQLHPKKATPPSNLPKKIKKETPSLISKKKKFPFNLSKKYYYILWIGLLVLCITGLTYSIFKTLEWNKDNNQTEELENKVVENITVEEVPDNENTILINEPLDETDIYWKYKDVSMINVDLKKLKEENADTIGWLQVLGTEINYPIVQSTDNDYYLKRDFLKRKNTGGWIFMDYRNQIDNLTENNIIYGHERFNKSMFGTLKNVLTEQWINNQDNHIIKVSTEKYNYLFQVFSVYTIPNEGYYITTDFSKKNSYKEFLKIITSRSIYNFNTEVNENTKILTLSTCYKDDARLAVHAKLIKMSAKN